VPRDVKRPDEFPEQMQQLGELVVVGTQMVMLTATLPPSKEEMWRRTMFEAEEDCIFQADTSRSNVHYAVEGLEEAEAEAEAEARQRQRQGQQVAGRWQTAVVAKSRR